MWRWAAIARPTSRHEKQCSTPLAPITRGRAAVEVGDRSRWRWHRARHDFAQQPIQIGPVKPPTAPALQLKVTNPALVTPPIYGRSGDP